MSLLKVCFIFQAIILLLAKAQNQVQNLATTTTLLSSPQAAFPFDGCPLYDDAAVQPIHFPYPYDCSKYYSCLKGIAYLYSCPNGLYWSSQTYRCDYPEVAKCRQPQVQPMPTPAPVPEPAQQQMPTVAPTRNFVYQAYPNDCSKYFQCQMMQCPTQLLWNAREERCDLPTYSTCAAYQPTPPLPTTQSTWPVYVPPATQQPSNILPPTAAKPLPPPPLPYTPYTPPYNVPWPIIIPIGAKNSTNEIPFNPLNPIENEFDQLCSKMGVDFVHYPGDCHRFIQCNGVAYVQKCPANLYWNSELSTCDRYCK